MQKLPEVVKRRRLDQIMLLGSHDSGAYRLDLNATPPMEKEPDLDLFKYFAEIDPEARQIIKNLTLSQPLSIFEQLEQGIRAFDFRILYNNLTQEFYLSHSYATVPMLPVLFQVNEFMSTHPGEVLVIEMQDDYEHENQTAPVKDQVISIVEGALGFWLIPVTHNQTLNNKMTLRNLVAMNQRILLTFTGRLYENWTNIWPRGVTVDFWPNGQSVNESLAVIETYLPELKISGQGFLNLVFFTVTPNVTSIIRNLIQDWAGGHRPDSLESWAKRMVGPAIEFIASNLAKLGGLNIVSVDAPTDAYVQHVIDWNTGHHDAAN